MASEYNKWHSRRWIIALWAMVCVTLITAWGLIVAPTIPWLPTVINLLLTLILSYIGSETITKAVFQKKENNSSTETKET